jgi:hypothetical protein
MQNIFSRSLVAALSWSAMSVALAADPVAIQSSISLDDLRYTLKDLHPADGVSPSFTASTALQANRIGLSAGDVAYPPILPLEAVPFDSSVGMITGPDFTAASKSGNNLAIKTNVLLPTVAAAVQSQSSKYIAAAGAFSISSWTLSPGTELTIQGTFNSSFDFDTAQLLASGAPNYGALTGDAFYTVDMYTLTPSGDLFIDDRVRGLWGEVWYPSTPQQDLPVNTQSRPFILSVSNRSSTSAILSLEINLSSRLAWGGKPPVPEPSTYALMALGLGLMAWRVRTARQA